jgi:UDP-2,3-diacylglucosamine pyrophosphatase LpxH
MATTEQTIPQIGLRMVEHWHEQAHERLNLAYQLSPHIYFDNTSRLVFFSDMHRGTKNRYDFFAPNETLFVHALTHYYHQGFTYIELGDGDELWYNDFAHIRRAYSQLFDLLHQFRTHHRLHLIIGNHDSPQGMFDPLEKENIPVHQGLVLHHAPSGHNLFAVHGHQAHPKGDRYWWFQRPYSRHVVKYTLPFSHTRYHFSEPEVGLPARSHLANFPRRVSDRILRFAWQLEGAILSWAQQQRQAIICGHTHLCAFPGAAHPAAQENPPFFNIGHCSTPGYITGLEMADGEMMLVKWKPTNQGKYERIVLRQMAITAVWP